MKDKKIILQEIKDIDNIILINNNLLKDFPNDNLLLISLNQATSRRKALIEEMKNKG